ncbi:MAG: hypothetical protein Q7J27_14715 [Syntrophales bacterium]|nr:hypothetical protein [Syntrophales bacterium]
MKIIQKQYIVDEKNQKIAVQIDFKTFQRIEAILEDYALAQLMRETENDETLDINQAKTYYQALEKA